MNLEEYKAFIGERLTTDFAREALEHYCSASKNPRMVLAVVQREANATSWHRVSWSLIEMAASDYGFAPIVLHRWAERIPEPTKAQLASSDASIAWEKVIAKYGLSVSGDYLEVRSRFAKAFDADALGSDVVEAWSQLTKINPQADTYRLLGSQEERVSYIVKKLHGDV
jgi:hypothetical protein